MKFCPVCQTRYDEEILRFCTKDGTPLVDENPSFAEMPSESEASDDIGEETIIRRNPPKNTAPTPAGQPDFELDDEVEGPESGQRIIISTGGEKEKEPVRAKAEPRYEPPPQKSNTALVVLATMFGTFTVLAVLAGAWYILAKRETANSNTNKNVNTNAVIPVSNLNTNFNVDNSLANFNTSSNGNVNTNTNVNANLKTPTPTRTPTPTPTPTPQDSNTNVNSNSNLSLGNTNIISRPSPTPSASPTVSPTPRTSPSPTTSPQNVNVGVMNSRAVSLTKPAYPQTAKQMNASGTVSVQITIDEFGIVTSARAISGHPLLRSPAENAARQSRFNPVKINDRAVSATGVVVYNFINQ